MAEAYPLQWPDGWPRTPYGRRRDSAYLVSETKARDELLRSVRLLGGRAVVLSTNIKLRLDGLPYANQAIPEDPGVAVYWTRAGKQEVMACDLWRRPWENMRAIGLAIEGLRAMERAGATQILERAFNAFRLPETAGASSWRVTLGFGPDWSPSADDVRRVAREMSARLHPDRPDGDEEGFKRVQQALAAALQELANP